MAKLLLQSLSKDYAGGVRAVSDITATIEDGEFVVLVGPSGCGKSTMLRMIAGLETITSGDLFIDGKRVNDAEPGDRDIAMVFQNYALYPHMSVRKNMEYGLRNEGRPRDEIDRRVAEAARMLQIGDYLDRKPRQLSGGQRQRVAMGRAIVRDPKVFLFDEPLSNLDAKLRTQLRAELKTLHDKLAATFVYVTHDQTEAMSLADRIAIMNAGRIEQMGPPMDLYHRPATRFVAEFIGNPSMNILDGRVSEDRKALVGNGAEIIRLPEALPAHAGEALCVGIRPEHLVKPTSDDGIALTMTVRFAENLGADTILHGTLADGTLIAMRSDNATDMHASGELKVAAQTDAVHIFDGTTGARIDWAA